MTCECSTTNAALTGVPTLAEAAERVLEQNRGAWRGRWHAQNRWRSMELRHASVIRY